MTKAPKRLEKPPSTRRPREQLLLVDALVAPVSYAGTYDARWSAEVAPEAPKDFRFSVYNAAHPALQIRDYLAGDELVSLTNLTPGGERVEFALPGLVPRVRVTSGQAQAKIPANLDTLVFVPDQWRFYQVWRACIPLKEAGDSSRFRVRITAS